MNQQITLTFFGSSPNSVTVLKALKQTNCNIVLIVTAPPRPIGRKKLITKTPVHDFALKEKIQVETPEILDKKFTDKFTSKPLDVAIVADYARLIPKEILNHPKHGCLNLHPSLLPKYRGSSPAETAILAGDKVTGMTIIQMDEKFDHGPIVAQFKEEIQPDDTSETLYQRLFSAGAKVLVTILPAWIEGRIVPRNQNHKKAKLAPRLTRDDGFIPWKIVNKAMQGEKISDTDLPLLFQKATQYAGKKPKDFLHTPISLILNRAIRAFHPWPGVWTILPTPKGKQRLKLLSAYLENNKLSLDQVQLEGKTPTSWKNISN
jgi:methionyl-tRNA formyltransferase